MLLRSVLICLLICVAFTKAAPKAEDDKEDDGLVYSNYFTIIPYLFILKSTERLKNVCSLLCIHSGGNPIK